MKTSGFLSCLVWAGILLLTGSCSTTQEFSGDASYRMTTHPIIGTQHHDTDCRNHSNSSTYMDALSGKYLFSMRHDNYPFCHKCGRYMQGRP